MSTRPLIIRLEQMKEILIAIDRARSRPVPRDVFDKLASAVPQNTTKVRFEDRKGFHLQREKYQPQQVLIEVGFRCAFSFEEQPAGLCRHLSISVEDEEPYVTPQEEAAQILARAFGIDPVNNSCWTEEYEPGKLAVNFVSLDRPGQRP
jgi:hypothetical protein